MQVKEFFDQETSTFSYIAYDDTKKDCIIFDSVLNYEPQASTINYTCINLIEEFINTNALKPHFHIDTHIHADHMSGACELKKRFPNIKLAISSKVTEVQKIFKNIFNLEELQTDGSQFDHLIEDNEILIAGSLKVRALATPGHTPACTCFLINETLFTGDALFMPDFGTGRCDFPGGSAEDLYNSLHEKLYKLPDETIVLVGHDYGTKSRDIAFKTTIGENKKHNIQLNEKTSLEEFLQFRNERDSQLKAPKLLLASLQVNLIAGNIPTPEKNGKSYLKIPLTLEK